MKLFYEPTTRSFYRSENKFFSTCINVGKLIAVLTIILVILLGLGIVTL